MIVLTKRSKEQFVVNHLQIECIESIPEVIAEYNAKVQDIHREITVTDRR